MKNMEPNPIQCLQDTYTCGKTTNTGIVMINTKTEILVTSEEEGGWGQGTIKRASVVFVSFYFFTTYESMGMCFISL